METKQIQIQLSNEVIGALRTAAAKKCITPGILARLILHEHFGRPDAGTDITEDDQTIHVPVRNYRELQGYAEERKLGNAAVFAAFAMERYMNQNSLSPAQKRRVEERYGISLER
jgi:hypothetical protein